MVNFKIDEGKIKGAFLVELIIAILTLACLGVVVVSVNLSKDIKFLRRRVERLENNIVDDRGAVAQKLSAGAPQPTQATSSAVEEEIEEWEPLPEEPETIVIDDTDTFVSNDGRIPRSVPEPAADNGGWEQSIGTKLPVWIGSIALIFAAFYMVKYSIEAGLLSPGVRLTLGTLFGVCLVGGGHWLFRRPIIANAERISQAMVGAGIVSLYFCFYAAAKLYGFISQPVAFGLMSAVTIVGVISALRHGSVIAVFALLGGLVTPALLSTGDANAMGLFSYLFLLSGCVMTVLVRAGRWLIGALAVIGSYLWVYFWIAIGYGSGDAFILSLFALGLCAQVLVLTGRHVMNNTVSGASVTQIHGLNFVTLIGGLITIFGLSEFMTLGLFEWAVLGLMSGGLMFLAYFRDDIYMRPLFVKMVVTIGLYLLWMDDVNFLEQLIVGLGLTVLYLVVPFALLRSRIAPKMWGAMQCAAALGLYLVAYVKMDLPFDVISNFDGFWGIFAFGLAAGFVVMVQSAQKLYAGDDTVRDTMVALYAFTASAFVSIGISIVLPWEYIPMAFAGQVMATSWIYTQVRIAFLKRAIVWLSLVTVILHFNQIILVISFAVQSLVGDYPYDRDLLGMVLGDYYIKLGLPVVLMSLGAMIYRRAGDAKDMAYRVMLGFVGAGGLLIVYYVVRHGFALYGGDVLMMSQAGFFERAAVTLAFAGVYLGMRYGFKVPISDRLTALMLGFVAFRFGYYDLLLHNPYWDGSQQVGNIVLWNGVTLVYGLGTVLGLTALLRDMTPRYLYLGIGVLGMFSFMSLSVTQFFQGTQLDGLITSDLEFYAYSVAWLLAGVILLALGIWRDNRMVRMSSLGFMVLTVIKVFVFDAGELEGLYRVLSFLGLGICLIGLSSFYHRYVFGKS